MTTHNSIVKLILDSNDSDNETVIDAQSAVISWFIANDGFRTPDLTLPPLCQTALMTLKDFTQHPAKYPPDVDVTDDGPEAA